MLAPMIYGPMCRLKVDHLNFCWNDAAHRVGTHWGWATKYRQTGQYVIGANSVPGAEGTGSGLGLSIVQSVAHKIGATVNLSHADDATQSGLSVQIAFRLA